MNKPLQCTCLTPLQKTDLKRAIGLLVSAIEFKRDGYKYQEGIEDIISELEHEANVDIERLRDFHESISIVPICPV